MRRISLLLIATVCALASCSRKSEAPAPATTTTATATTTTQQPPVADATTTDVTVTIADPKAPNVQTVDFGDGARGYLVLPKTTGKHPAMIVVQEWWGMNEWVREQADRFAANGYVTLAPDLYRGKVTNDPKVAHELMRGMPEDRVNADLKAAFTYLASRDDVDPKLIGVIGWCMGGGYALNLATNEPRLAAAAVNYGMLVTDPNRLTKIHAQLLGNFGAEDRGIPPADVKAFGAALTKYGKLADIKVYDGAGHAFMNPNNTEGYRPDATKDAWARIDRFFDRTLRDKITNS